jgi:peptidyl-tRNA hydrolase, PTH1 family
MAFFSFLKFFFRKAEALPQSVDMAFFGLGNIGEKYTSTRHNIGFRVAESVSGRLENRHTGCFAEADFISGKLFSARQALVVKPRTLMNRSGDAVKEYKQRFGIAPPRMLVIVDDYNLPLGKLRARRDGSDGGHNGLKSIIARVGENFPRLRVGIGPLPGNKAVIDFVLGSFSEDEEEQLRTVIPRAAEACLLFAQEGIEAVMNKYNR